MKALLVVASLTSLIVGPLVAGITAAPASRPQTGQAAKAVDYKLLIALLPNIPGWEKDEATGDQSEMMEMTFSRTEVAYNKGDVNVLVAGRFIVHASGYDLPSLDLVKEVIAAVPAARLAALK